MTKNKLYTFATLAVMCFSTIQAQNDTISKNPKKDTQKSYSELMDSNFKDSLAAKYYEEKKNTKTDFSYSGHWIIGVGINMIEDSGNQEFSDLFTLKHKNFGSPFMASVEYLISNKISVSTTALYNKYQSGKEIQGLMLQDASQPSYLAVDLAAKIFLWKVLSEHKFTPYVTAGFGYRTISSYQAEDLTGTLVEVPKASGVTINAGLGAYYWIDDNWGLNASYIAKFAKVGGTKNNHLVSSFGVFYRFSNKYFD